MQSSISKLTKNLVLLVPWSTEPIRLRSSIYRISNDQNLLLLKFKWNKKEIQAQNTIHSITQHILRATHTIGVDFCSWPCATLQLSRVKLGAVPCKEFWLPEKVFVMSRPFGPAQQKLFRKTNYFATIFLSLSQISLHFFRGLAAWELIEIFGR